MSNKERWDGTLPKYDHHTFVPKPLARLNIFMIHLYIDIVWIQANIKPEFQKQPIHLFFL